MIMRLALALGEPHPDKLAEELTSQEFSEWIAFYRIEPFGPQVDDLRAGVIAATMANTGRAKNSKAYQPADFFPSLRDEPDNSDRMTVDETKNAVARALGVTRPGA